MGEVIDRVAAVIREKISPYTDTWGSMISLDDLAADAAEGAVAAMRGPTDAMIAAGDKVMSASQPIYDYDAETVWVTMVDEALK